MTRIQCQSDLGIFNSAAEKQQPIVQSPAGVLLDFKLPNFYRNQAQGFDKHSTAEEMKHLVDRFFIPCRQIRHSLSVNQD